MNILFINHYHIYDIPGGGIEFSMDVYAKSLARLGHQVSIVAQYMDDDKPYLERIDNLYDAYRIKGIKGRMVFRIPGIIKIVKEVKPDIILTAHYIYLRHGYLIGKLTNCKVASFLHDDYEIYGYRKPFNLFAYLNRKFTRYLDGIIADTNRVSKIILDETGVKCSVSYIGFDLSEHDIKMNYRTYSDIGEPFKFIFIGRLVKEKGVDILAEAFNKFKVNYPNSKCVFIGGGKYLEEFRTKYKQQPSIEIKGFLEEKNMLAELISADVFVNPTYLQEGIILVNIQSMKLGVPVISTNTGSVTEAITDGSDGILIRTKSVEELYIAMEALAINSELSKKMAVKALETSKRFNEEISAKNLERILYGII